MKKKNSIKERAKKVPLEIKLMVSRSMATAKQITKILDNQGKNQKDLAILLGKKESEISKWLRGTHNFTFKTISKIEAVLGEQIILTADQAMQNIHIITAVVADNKEHPICLVPKSDTNFIDLKEGITYTLKSGSSNLTKTERKPALTDLCFAN